LEDYYFARFDNAEAFNEFYLLIKSI